MGLAGWVGMEGEKENSMAQALTAERPLIREGLEERRYPTSSPSCLGIACRGREGSDLISGAQQNVLNLAKPSR